MNHTRLLVLLKCKEAPEWFVQAMNRSTPQELWTEITQGSDPGDQALLDANEFVAGHSAR